MDIHARLSDLGLTLPPAPQPIASYVPAQLAGDLLYVSGQLPMLEGRLIHAGRVPDEVSPEEARQCAQRCVLNCLAVVNDHVGGDWSRLARVVRIGVFINTAGGYERMADVANGASDLLAGILDEAGRHARATTGAAGLPLNAPVEIEMLAALKA